LEKEEREGRALSSTRAIDLGLVELALSALLEEHVVLRLETHASAEDVLEGGTLAEESVDDRGASGDQGSLEEVREEGEDGAHRLELVHVLATVLDALHELSEDDEVEHDGGSEQAVLARVVEGNRVRAAHENLADVLVEGALRVTDSGDVLNDDSVVGMLALRIPIRKGKACWRRKAETHRLVENAVGLDHVIDDVGLGDLLGAELLRSAEVHAVVVAEVVVRGDSDGLDTSAHQEVNEDRLDLHTKNEAVTSQRREESDKGLTLV